MKTFVRCGQLFTGLEDEAPVFKSDLRCWPSRKNRKIRCYILAWRYTVFCSFLLPPGSESTGNRPLVHGARTSAGRCACLTSGRAHGL